MSVWCRMVKLGGLHGPHIYILGLVLSPTLYGDCPSHCAAGAGRAPGAGRGGRFAAGGPGGCRDADCAGATSTTARREVD